jgi:broad specificity phosphatase PhoE
MAAEPMLVLIRHSATEWSENGRHTSHTDLPLLPSGIERARALAPILAPHTFARVLSSPLQRARRTGELAGFADRLEITPGLTEWDYGDYEGLTSQQINATDPDWNLWHDGCPGGESPAEVTARVDRVIADAVTAGGDVLMFAHGHVLRSLAARWMGLEVDAGEHLALWPASICVLGHERETRVIERWNASRLLVAGATRHQP